MILTKVGIQGGIRSSSAKPVHPSLASETEASKGPSLFLFFEHFQTRTSKINPNHKTQGIYISLYFLYPFIHSPQNGEFITKPSRVNPCRSQLKPLFFDGSLKRGGTIPRGIEQYQQHITIMHIEKRISLDCSLGKFYLHLFLHHVCPLRPSLFGCSSSILLSLLLHSSSTLPTPPYLNLPFSLLLS